MVKKTKKVIKKRAKKITSQRVVKTKRKINKYRRNPHLTGKWFILIDPSSEKFVIGQLDRKFESYIWLTPHYSSSFYSFHDFWSYPNNSPFVVYGNIESISPDNKHTYKTNISNLYGPFDSKTEAYEFMVKKYKLEG